MHVIRLTDLPTEQKILVPASNIDYVEMFDEEVCDVVLKSGAIITALNCGHCIMQAMQPPRALGRTA